MPSAASKPVQVLMAEVLHALPAVGKDSTNEAQGFKFRSIDALMDVLNPALGQAGILVVPEALELRTEVDPRQNGQRTVYWCRATVHVRFTVHGPAGDSLVGAAWGEGLDNADKATAKAHTGAFKTFLGQAFCIAFTDDEEPDHGSPVQEATSGPVRAAQGTQRAAAAKQGEPASPSLPPHTAALVEALGALSADGMRKFVAWRKEAGLPSNINQVGEDQATQALAYARALAGAG